MLVRLEKPRHRRTVSRRPMRVSGGFQEAHRQGGGHGEREDERREQSGHHGERERAEEHTRHPVEECEWDEDHHGRERRAEEREADLANRLPNCVNGARAAHTLRMDVLDHHDRIIDNEADGRRDPPERHQVEAQVKWLHRGDGDQHGQRDHQDGHRRQPDVLQERDHDADREHEPEHDAFPDRTSRLAHQDRLVVEGRELHVARQDRAERVELLVHAGRHLDRARVRLAPNVEEHGVDAPRGHDVEARGAPALDPGDVAEEDRGARRPEPHDGRGNVVGRGESPAHERQVQLVILLQHARGRDEVGRAQPVHQVGQREPPGGELGGVGDHVEFGLAAADEIHAGDALHARQARLDHVARRLPDVGDVPVRCREADPDDRKGGEGEPPDQRLDHVDLPVEEDVDLRRTPAGRRADRLDPRDVVHGLLDRAGDRGHHLVGRHHAAVDQDHHPREGRLGEDRGGQREGRVDARCGQGEGHELDRPRVPHDEAGKLVQHVAR